MKKIAFSYIIVYLVFGLFTLSIFPMIFIDEPWLGERAYNLVHNGTMHQMSFPYSANYMTFDGDIFLLLNALAIKFFGYNIFALRLFNLLFFAGTLILLFQILTKFFNNKIGLAFVVLFSIHPFAVNASRLSRKESIVLFFVMLGIYLFTVNQEKLKPRKLFLLGFIFSIPILSHALGSVGILMGLALIIINSYPIWKQIFRNCVIFISGTAPALLLFLYNFLNNKKFYLEHAKLKGTFENTLWLKLKNYVVYLYNGFDLSLFHNLYFIFILILSILALLGFRKMTNKNSKRGYICFSIVFGILNLFLMWLSNFSRLYLIYILLFGLILLIIPLYYLDKRKIIFSAVVLWLGTLFIFQDYVWVNYYKDLNYKSFELGLITSIPANSNVLGKINYQLSFTRYRYFATEDLFEYISSGGDFTEYIEKYNIQYIVYDYSWDHYQSSEEIKTYLNNNAKLISTVKDKFYSNRIGPEDTNHISLPYFNLTEIAKKNKIVNEQYWTKIYKIKS